MVQCFVLFNLFFVFVIYGVGGLIWEWIYKIVECILNEIDLVLVVYLICVGLLKVEVDVIVKDYWDLGVCYLVVLCGDLFVGIGVVYELYVDGYVYVLDLVVGIKKIVNFDVFVFGYFEKYLESGSWYMEIENLKCKVDVGVDWIII